MSKDIIYATPQQIENVGVYRVENDPERKLRHATYLLSEDHILSFKTRMEEVVDIVHWLQKDGLNMRPKILVMFWFRFKSDNLTLEQQEVEQVVEYETIQYPTKFTTDTLLCRKVDVDECINALKENFVIPEFKKTKNPVTDQVMVFYLFKHKSD